MASMLDRPSEHELRRVWNANAGFWDDFVGADGNEFHRLLVAPAQMDLLALQPGERVVELGCGNGQFARHMADAGATVVASDFSATFLERARSRTAAAGLAIEFHLADATEREEVLELGEPGSFAAAVCTMAFHDIADLRPMASALAVLLEPDGRFVFTMMHPCFNGASVGFVTETTDVDGDVRTTHAIKIERYAGLEPSRGIGIAGQPEPHWYFPRTLAETLAPFFDAGWVLDGIVEPTFPPGTGPGTTHWSWWNRPALPPVLAGRLRPPRGAGTRPRGEPAGDR
jgi:SAM-dependent methyltransferase